MEIHFTCEMNFKKFAEDSQELVQVLGMTLNSFEKLPRFFSVLESERKLLSAFQRQPKI